MKTFTGKIAHACGFFALTALLCGVSVAGPVGEPAREVKKGTITGKITVTGGAPLSWGQVMLYDASVGPPPMPEKYERTPDISRDLDAEGMFKVDLLPGKYYLGAIKRMSGERFGPPQDGDYVVGSGDEKGRPREYVIQPGAVLDVGTLATAAPVKARDYSGQSITTAIEGAVIDTEGKSIDDAVVIAFVNPSMKGRPLFISNKTGKDGKYVLRLTAGTYYLRVRNSLAGGPPEAGQIVGYYGDGTPTPVVIKDGERRKGIDFKVILFGGRGPRSDSAPQPRQ